MFFVVSFKILWIHNTFREHPYQKENKAFQIKKNSSCIHVAGIFNLGGGGGVVGHFFFFCTLNVIGIGYV